MVCKRSFHYILFLLACTAQIHSQTTLSGHVTDTTNTPIPMVNVFLTKVESTSILKYTYTDDAGFYRLMVDQAGEYILHVNGLSYREFSTRIKIDSVATTPTIAKEIILTQESQYLDEVVVNANLPVLVKKDTVVIRVASFINGSEDVAEDILKKLPGIEVAPDGTVKVQGRNVEKVMIEGDDLFERGYKLLTKNLNAGVVDKVEILQHFSDNPLLKNIEDSEDVALNIVLKEEVKSTLFGNMELGFGFKKAYENKLNVISIKKKTKYYVFGNMNTVGNDATGDIFQLVYPEYITGNTYIGDGISASRIMGMTIDQPSIEGSRFNFNEAELASINGVFNPSEKLKIKGLLYFTSDENGYFRTQNEYFNVGEVGFLNAERYALYTTSKMASSKIQANVKIDQNHHIEYVGKLNLGRFLYKGTVDFNAITLNPSLLEDTKNTDHRITYTGKINKKSAYQLTSRYVSDRKPQHYFFDDFIYQGLLPENDPIQSISAKSHIKTSFVGFESTLFSKGARNNLEIRTGYSWQGSRLLSSLFLNAQMGPIDVGTAYQNDFKFELGDLYLKSNFRQYFGSVSMSLSLDAHRYFAHYIKSLPVKDAPFNLIPGLAFSWQINKDNKIIVSYKYGLKNTQLEDIYDGYILSNYRFFQKGLGSFQQFRGNFFLASYFLGDWQDSFLLNGTIIHNQENGYLADNTVVRQNYVQSSPIPLAGKEFFSMNLSVDRFIEALSTNVKLKGNLTDNSFQNVVNATLRDITIRTYDYGLEIRSIFPNAINFHLGHTMTLTEVASPEQNRTQSSMSFLEVDVKASEKLSFQLKNDRYSYGQSGSSSTFYFSDLRAKYQIKPNKISLKLDVVNIWNTRNIGTLDISDTGYLQSSYRLLPRYILLAMTYRW